MRSALIITAACTLVVSITAPVAFAATAPDTASCGQYGTSVHFEKTPSAAAHKALKEEKLVLVLHVSGDFENPAFT